MGFIELQVYLYIPQYRLPKFCNIEDIKKNISLVDIIVDNSISFRYNNYMKTSKYIPLIRDIMRENPTIRLWDMPEGDSYDHGLEIPDMIRKEDDMNWIELWQLHVKDGEIQDMNRIKEFTTNHSYKDIYETLKKYTKQTRG
jgi:hypothetical protein